MDKNKQILRAKESSEIKCQSKHTKVNEYGQEIPQSHSVDQPTST